MSLLGAVPSWSWWLVALALVAGGQQYRVAVAQGDTVQIKADLADYRLQIAERDRRAAAQARAEEQRRQTVADEEGESARKELELRIPRSSGHPFHKHLTTDSTVIRPPIPRVSDH